MKCPKCEYLGYDTGTRCRNCGYDFSLADTPASTAADLRLNESDRQTPVSVAWLDQFALNTPEARPAGAPSPAPSAVSASAPIASAPTLSRDRAASAPMPLFARVTPDDDEPLIKLPVAPRAPLSVRKTPETPRLRAVANAAPRRALAETGPALDFPDETEPAQEPAAGAALRAGAAVPAPGASRRQAGTPDRFTASAAVPRLLAAILDHGLLLAIDAAVLYFTLRVAGLTPADWTLLPPVPVVFFLGLIKVGYFASFTALGGQTLGKMAAGITVVADDGQRLDPGRAVTRALAGAVSLGVGGLGFIPALVGGDRRALHDRLAGTRVIVRTA